MKLTRKEAIDIIKNHPNNARMVFNKIIEKNLLDTPIRDGAWTPKQIFHHLADSYINSYIRLKLALTEEHPTVKPYSEPLWAELEDVKSIPVEVSLQILDGIHKRISYLLKHFLDTDRKKFDRTFHHPESGDKTVGEHVINFANHGTRHLESIKTLIT